MNKAVFLVVLFLASVASPLMTYGSAQSPDDGMSVLHTCLLYTSPSPRD